MKQFILMIMVLNTFSLFAQSDSLLPVSSVVVHKDFRLDILGRKEAELNAAAIAAMSRSAMGYRLQVLNTNDREQAMKTKTQLLQQFPEQKTYMFYQSPYVKLRFGNFKTRPEAEAYRKQISRMMGGASIYIIPERIEVKPDKDAKEEDQ
ncbi:MAG: SPOR domain-containing protein [Ginsengibacter sp.]